MTALKKVLFIGVFILSLVLIVSHAVVKAETEQQINQQKSEKEQELSKILKDISSIASSSSSISSKLSSLRNEKTKMEKLLSSMAVDLKVIEGEADRAT